MASQHLHQDLSVSSDRKRDARRRGRTISVNSLSRKASDFTPVRGRKHVVTRWQINDFISVTHEQQRARAVEVAYCQRCRAWSIDLKFRASIHKQRLWRTEHDHARRAGAVVTLL